MNSNMLVFPFFFFFWTSKWEQVSCNSWHILSQKWSTDFFFFFKRETHASAFAWPQSILPAASHLNQLPTLGRSERPVLMWPFTLSLTCVCFVCSPQCASRVGPITNITFQLRWITEHILFWAFPASRNRSDLVLESRMSRKRLDPQ